MVLLGRVQSTCVQPLAARNRHLRAAGLLECCAGPDNPRRLANWLAETALWEIVGDLTEEVATEAGLEAEGGV